MEPEIQESSGWRIGLVNEGRCLRVWYNRTTAIVFSIECVRASIIHTDRDGVCVSRRDKFAERDGDIRIDTRQLRVSVNGFHNVFNHVSE